MEVEIVENKKALLKDFIALNEEWIAKYFELEESDHALARDPEKIIRNDGFVFFAMSEGEVAGVCALFNDGGGVYELARMAVAPKFQGRGIGHALIVAAIGKAHSLNVSRLYLISNTKLEAAIALYKKHGFIVEALGQHPIYSRANITMAYNEKA